MENEINEPQGDLNANEAEIISKDAQSDLNDLNAAYNALKADYLQNAKLLLKEVNLALYDVDSGDARTLRTLSLALKDINEALQFYPKMPSTAILNNTQQEFTQTAKEMPKIRVCFLDEDGKRIEEMDAQNGK